MTRQDWLLLLLGTRDGEGQRPAHLDRARLMKALFVFGQGMSDLVGDGYYSFRPYHYGPFDRSVYDDAESQCESGLISEVHAPYPAYSVTVEGEKRAVELAAQVPPEALEYLHVIRRWATSVDFATLVKAIYQKWPEMRARSRFRDPAPST